jgi:hypothetical protein
MGINVLYFKVGEPPEVIELPEGDHLKEMQRLVGGYVEVIAGPTAFSSVWCNDEGRINELPRQKRFPSLMPIAGNFFLTSSKVGPDGETIGLNDIQIAKLKRLAAEFFGERGY